MGIASWIFVGGVICSLRFFTVAGFAAHRVSECDPVMGPEAQKPEYVELQCVADVQSRGRSSEHPWIVLLSAPPVMHIVQQNATVWYGDSTANRADCARYISTIDHAAVTCWLLYSTMQLSLTPFEGCSNELNKVVLLFSIMAGLFMPFLAHMCARRHSSRYAEKCNRADALADVRERARVRRIATVLLHVAEAGAPGVAPPIEPQPDNEGESPPQYAVDMGDQVPGRNGYAEV